MEDFDFNFDLNFEMVGLLALAGVCALLLVFLVWCLVKKSAGTAKLILLETQLDEVKRERDEARAKMEELNRELSATTEKLNAEKKNLENFERKQKELFETMKLEFSAISNKMFEQHSEKFKTASKSEIDALIKPFAENVGALKKQIEESFKSENTTTATLCGEIRTLLKHSETISTEARNLTNALRGNAKVQGDWGEMLLETALQSAGLIAGTHYLTQNKIEVEGQTRGRTDFEILLPNERRIIVDSKVSLNAYVDYCNADNEKSRGNAQKAHLASVKKHIDELAGKYKKDDSLEFVLMFVPNEAAYLLACETDQSLWDYAFKKQIVLVSGTHLLAVVKLIEQLWSQDSRIKNIQKITEIGEKLLKKFSDAMSDFGKIEDRLEKTQSAVNDFKTKMSGKGGALKLANDMKELGVKAPGNLPKFEDVPAEIEV